MRAQECDRTEQMPERVPDPAIAAAPSDPFPTRGPVIANRSVHYLLLRVKHSFLCMASGSLMR